MDGDRFDTLIRSLTVKGSRRGVTRRLGGLTLGSMLLPVLGLAEARARKKCKPKCKGKACGPDGCKGKCGTCQKDEKCTGTGKCKCVPESQTKTCNGRCGTWANNCGKAVTCPGCPPLRACLANGSCAVSCTANEECGSCGCSVRTNTEGQRHCVPFDVGCTARQCERTADCPPGSQCANCGAQGLRCTPLCGCIDDSDCSGGEECSGGVCGTPVNCTNPVTCVNAGDCCSESCTRGGGGADDPLRCACSEAGQACSSDGDCCPAARPCTGFVCSG
jgi:hypothetical protein